jgi:membrane-bound inhibitor of C-type lysozyme
MRSAQAEESHSTRWVGWLGMATACALLSACSAIATESTGPSHAPVAVGEITGPGFSSHSVRYRCSQSEVLEVAYLNLADGRAFAALHHEGRTALLQSRPTASGARYIALDEQHSLRWHTRGPEGQLSFMAADHTATERPLLRDCRAASLP